MMYLLMIGVYVIMALATCMIASYVSIFATLMIFEGIEWLWDKIKKVLK